jgi:hypothetical protein
VVPEFTEVLRAQTEECGAVELGVAAHVVVDLGRELVSVFVVPELRCAVLALDEDRGGFPVVAFAGQIVAAFEEEDPFSGGGQPVGEGAAARTGADDDDVVMPFVGHSGHRPRSTLRFAG